MYKKRFPFEKKKDRLFRLSVIATVLAMTLPSLVNANEIGSVTIDGIQKTVDTTSPIKIGKNANIVVIEGGSTHGIQVEGKDNEAIILGKNITVTVANGSNETVEARNKGQITLGDANTEMISLTGPDTGLLAIRKQGHGSVEDGAHINVQTEKLTISGSKTGIWVQNDEVYDVTNGTVPNGSSSVTINAKDTIITAEEAGIVALSNGQVNINGNLTINAPKIIDTRGYSTVNINQDGKGSVVLNGDITFETPSYSGGGNVIDSNVNINLTTADSSWTGNVQKKPGGNREDVTGMTLKLSNGAQWNPTVIQTSDEPGKLVKEQAINNLDLNGGIINIKTAGQQVKAENLSGKGGTVNVAAQKQGDTLTNGQLNIEFVTEGNTPPTSTSTSPASPQTTSPQQTCSSWQMQRMAS